MRPGRTAAVGALVLVAAASCRDTADHPSRSAPSTTTSTTVTATTVAPPPASPAPVHIAVRLDRRVDDPATAGFDEVVRSTLLDPRGWRGAGFELSFADDAPYTVVLAEGDVVDNLCRPYDVGGRFSCQNGPVVALNADRWRSATPQWTGDLDGYRRMLVNHEVGHLLGQHHPVTGCPEPGALAPVMTQQSTELRGCLPNPWPLPWELACAARRLEPIAPGYEPDPTPLCGPDG